jgi:hypothetical protein
MSSEIQPTRKAIEGEIITEKTPEQAGRELGEAWAKLKQTVTDLSKGFKQVSGKPPIVLEDKLTEVWAGKSYGELELTLESFEDYRKEKEFFEYVNKLQNLKGKRVRITIEALEDNP